IQIEYFQIATTANGLGNGVGFCVIPLELQAVVLSHQVPCREAVVEAVTDLNSAKQRSRQIKPTIELAANVGRDFKILGGSNGNKKKDEAPQRGEEGCLCIHGYF